MKLVVNIVMLLLFSCLLTAGNHERYKQLVGLQGSWKFMIGDEARRADINYNDNDWELINVPSAWENQGFPGYDGYAWYRKSVVISSDYKNLSLFLFLGVIDDVDEVFFNGVKIGSKGSFPPNFWTAYNAERKYIIPYELIKFGQPNVIAVRVYDSQIDGGIMSGEVGIFARQSDFVPDVNLEGYWKFSTGDNMDWALKTFDDSKWRKIIVPGSWEDQVAADYDGYGWYRRVFTANVNMADKRFVLMLGKIDDLDEVYLNGKLVGQTGKIYKSPSLISLNWEFNKERYYYLEPEDIIPGKVNTIAIRVYDGGGEGGIYTGTIGLIEMKRFVTYWRNKGK